MTGFNYYDGLSILWSNVIRGQMTGFNYYDGLSILWSNVIRGQMIGVVLLTVEV